MFRRLTTYTLAITLALATALGVTTAPAFAGEDKGLCNEDHSRGTIPGDFPLDVCFDGKTLFIKNSKDVPASLTIIGNDVKTPERLSQGATPASRVLAFIRPGDFSTAMPQIGGPSFRDGTIPPKHLVKFPVGNGEFKVKVGKASTETMQYYMIAEALWKYLPGTVTDEVMRVIGELIRELADVGRQNVACHDRNTGWGDLGCSALLGRNVTYAFGRAAVNGLVKGAFKVIITLFDGGQWAATTKGDFADLGKGKRDFTIAAYKAPAKPPTNNPPPGNPGGSTGGGGNNGGGNPPPPGNNNPPPPPVYTATVQNKHLEGGSGLGEDSTPAYLSTQMVSFCKSKGCAIGGTDMWSGATFQAHCWADGALMTNENRNRPEDDSNPNRIDTTKWMKGTVNGLTGWISYVYITPGSRSLGVPHC